MAEFKTETGTKQENLLFQFNCRLLEHMTLEAKIFQMQAKAAKLKIEMFKLEAEIEKEVQDAKA